MTLQTPKRRPASVRRRAVRVVAITSLMTASLGGLAYAGALPNAMQNAFSSAAARVGFDLPAADAHRQDAAHRNEQSTQQSTNSKRVNDDVRGVLDDDSLEGRDKGDAVSDAASQNRQNDEQLEGSTVPATDIPPLSDRGHGRPNEPGKP